MHLSLRRHHRSSDMADYQWSHRTSYRRPLPGCLGVWTHRRIALCPFHGRIRLPMRHRKRICRSSRYAAFACNRYVLRDYRSVQRNTRFGDTCCSRRYDVIGGLWARLWRCRRPGSWIHARSHLRACSGMRYRARPVRRQLLASRLSRRRSAHS